MAKRDGGLTANLSAIGLLVLLGSIALGLLGALPVASAAAADDVDARVPVIVELDVGFVPPGLLTAPAAGLQERIINLVRHQVGRGAFALDGEVTTEFALVPYLGLSVAPEDLDALAGLPGVRNVAADETVRPLLDQSLPVVGAAVPAPSFAGLPVTGAGQAIAIIDTGIDASHPFFARPDDPTASRVVAEACFARGQDGSRDTPGDCRGGAVEEIGPGAAHPLGDHGIHVAGIAAGAHTAATPAGAPARGVAPAADLVVARTFNLLDQGGHGAYISDLVHALEWILRDVVGTHDLAAVNLSVGSSAAETCNGNGSWNAFVDAAESLRVAGVLTVSSAGNGGNRDRIGAPACLTPVVAVAATDLNGEIASYSDVRGNDEDLLLAPGSSIRSASLDNRYAHKTGTSAAAPHLAGALALLREAQPTADPDDLLAALRASATLIDDTRPAGTAVGLPLLDLPTALTALPGAPGAPSAPRNVEVAEVPDHPDGTVVVSWAAPQSAGASRVQRYDVLAAPGGAGCTSVATGDDPPPMTCTVTGLQVGTAHTFSLTATNEQGTSPSSGRTAAVTPRRAPSSPTDLTATPGDTQVTLTWQTPNDDGGLAITGYRIEQSTDTTTWTTTTPATTTGTTATITGLTNGTTYRFRVIATNDRGQSTPSQTTAPTTPDGPTPAGNETAGNATAGNETAGTDDPDSGTTSDDNSTMVLDEFVEQSDPTNPIAAPGLDADGSPLTSPPGVLEATVDGSPVPATSRADRSGLWVDADDLRLRLTPIDLRSHPTSRLSGTTLTLDRDGGLHLDVFGAQASSLVGVWLVPGPVLLGAPPTDSEGRSSGTFALPPTTALGEATLQVRIPRADGTLATLALGVLIEQPTVGFPDLDPDAFHAPSIRRMVALGITTGYQDGTFRPSLAVTRGQMASFLARALHLGLDDEDTAGSTTGPATAAFIDTVGTTHAAAIDAVHAAGIAGGFPDGTYRPGEAVTRGQMATFLARAAGLDIDHDAGPAVSEAWPFTDIAGTTHAAAILAVQDAGIARGYSGGTFSPGAPITRAQMASFLMRMLDHVDHAADELAQTAARRTVTR